MNSGWRWLALGCGATVAAWPAAAAEWALDSGLQVQATREDRRPDGSAGQSVDEWRVRGNASLARNLENQGTRAEVALDVPVAASDTRLTQGSVNLSQRLALPTDSLAGSLQYAVDDNRGERRSAVDEFLGRARRTRLAWQASWQHAFDERWGALASAGDSHLQLDDPASGEPYRNRQLGLSTTWLADERTSLTAALSSGVYRLDSGDGRSSTDSVNLSLTRALDERSSLTLGAGRYRTRSERVLHGLVCPLPVQFCESGLVAPVPVSLVLDSTSRGTQYSLDWQQALQERTRLSLATSRQLAPSALGVSRTDALTVGLTHAWSPVLDLSFVASRSASRTPQSDGSELQPKLDSLESSLNWRLDERVSVSAAARWRRLSEPVTGSGGRTVQFSISLQYQLPRIVATR